MNVAEYIKQSRVNAGISQVELANRIGTTPQNISQYERGIRNPKYETLQRIADALDISTDTLLGRNQPLAEAPAAPADEMNRLLAKLNSDGQKVAIERVEELTEIPKYQRKKPDD